MLFYGALLLAFSNISFHFYLKYANLPTAHCVMLFYISTNYQ